MQWQPTASLATLKKRAQLIQHIRQFFTDRDILEVETPILSRAATPDPALHSFQTIFESESGASQEALYLHTSPEFFMKRMLAAEYGAIYQIARVFRNAECGKRHNPEFTLLEWYRPGFDMQQLMSEVEDLFSELCATSSMPVEPAQRVTYRQLFLDSVSLDPHIATVNEWQNCLLEHDIQLAFEQPLSSTEYCDLLMTHAIEPAMPQGMCFVYDYPAGQAALARVRMDEPPVAERFELYFNGMEMANGFYELTDAKEQRQRFLDESNERAKQGQVAVPIDEFFLSALENGMPDASGVAVGIDRLMMALLEQSSIDRVIAFPYASV